MLGLSTTLWRQLVGWPDQIASAAPAASAGVERRIWVRTPSEATATFQQGVGTDDGRFSAQVRNISRGGINFLAEQHFESGAILSVELPGTDGRSYTVLACVAHVTAEAEGQWAVGCRFSCELGDADLRAFAAATVAPAETEQRKWVRFRSKARASYALVAANEESRQQAQVINLSANGVALCLEQSVQAGALLNLELHGPTSSRIILACVVRVEPEAEGLWLVGCNFIRDLTDQELEALSR
jgi:hypothetical protein